MRGVAVDGGHMMKGGELVDYSQLGRRIDGGSGKVVYRSLRDVINSDQGRKGKHLGLSTRERGCLLGFRMCHEIRILLWGPRIAVG